MDIKDLQNLIYDFQKKRLAELKAELTSELVFLHLSEEIGEIARQLINNKHSQFRRYDEDNLKEEITQALLDLLVLSKIYDIDLNTECIKKIENMKTRKPEKII